MFADFFGDHSEEDPPVPIPNTEVKLFSADGTAWETVWESRSSPNFLYSKPLGSFISQGAFCVQDASLLRMEFPPPPSLLLGLLSTTIKTGNPRFFKLGVRSDLNYFK